MTSDAKPERLDDKFDRNLEDFRKISLDTLSNDQWQDAGALLSSLGVQLKILHHEVMVRTTFDFALNLPAGL